MLKVGAEDIDVSSSSRRSNRWSLFRNNKIIHKTAQTTHLDYVLYGRSAYSNNLATHLEEASRDTRQGIKDETEGDLLALKNSLERYYHTNKGLFSAAHGASLTGKDLGEKVLFETNQEQGTNDKLDATLTSDDRRALNIRVDTQLAKINCPKSPPPLDDNELQEILKFFSGDCATLAWKTTFVYKYIDSELTKKYQKDVRRQLLSYVLKQDVDAVAIFSYREMAHALIDRLKTETPSSPYADTADTMTDEDVEKHGISLSTVSRQKIDISEVNESVASVPKKSMIPPKSCDAFKNEDYKLFENYLAATIQWSFLESDQEQASKPSLVFLANSGTVFDKAALHTPVMQREIFAGAFVELAVLHFLRGLCNLSLQFTADQQIGVNIALLYYLENPLPDCQNSQYISQCLRTIRSYLDNSQEFDLTEIKKIINYLIEVFFEYSNKIKDYYTSLNQRASAIMWQSIKLRLQELQLQSKLEDLAKYTRNDALMNFAKKYDSHLGYDLGLVSEIDENGPQSDKLYLAIDDGLIKYRTKFTPKNDLVELEEDISRSDYELLYRAIKLSNLEGVSLSCKNSLLNITSKKNHTRYVKQDSSVETFMKLLSDVRVKKLPFIIIEVITALQGLAQGILRDYRDCSEFCVILEGSQGAGLDFFEQNLEPHLRNLKVYLLQLGALNLSHILALALNDAPEFSRQCEWAKEQIKTLQNNAHFKYDIEADITRGKTPITSSWLIWRNQELLPIFANPDCAKNSFQLAAKLYLVQEQQASLPLLELIDTIFLTKDFKDYISQHLKLKKLEDIAVAFSETYYEAINEKNFYLIFIRMTDTYLEVILDDNEGNIFSALYLQAIFFRHLLIGFSSQYFSTGFLENDKAKFIYHKFLEYKIRQALLIDSKQPGIDELTGIVEHINHAGKKGKLDVNTLSISLEDAALGPLKPSARHLLRLCAWLSVLVFRDLKNSQRKSDEDTVSQPFFSDAELSAIHDKINAAILGLSECLPEIAGAINEISIVWQSYLELDKSRRETIEAWFLHGPNSAPSISASTAAASSNSSARHSVIKSYLLYVKRTIVYSASESQENTPEDSLNSDDQFLGVSIVQSNSFDKLSEYPQLQKFLWRQVAISLFYALESEMQKRPPSARRSGTNSLKSHSSSMKDYLSAQVIEIFRALFDMCQDDITPTHVDLAVRISSCISDLVEKKAGAKVKSEEEAKIKEKAKIKAKAEFLCAIKKGDRKCANLVRGLYFNDEEHHIFAVLDYHRALEEAVNNDAIGFLDKLFATIAFVHHNVQSDLCEPGRNTADGEEGSSIKHLDVAIPSFSGFIPELMEPLLFSFIVVYQYLKKIENKSEIFPRSFYDKWFKKEINDSQSKKIEGCLRMVEELDKITPGKPVYTNFIDTWSRLIQDVFIALQKNIEHVSRKQLQFSAIDLVRAAKSYHELNMKQAVEYTNNLWREDGAFYNFSSVLDPLFFLFGPIAACPGLVTPRVEDEKSKKVTLTQRHNNSVSIQQQLVLFFTHESVGFFRHQKTFPIREALYANGVFCVLLNDDYPTRWSKYVAARSLDQMAHYVLRIYEERLHSFEEVRGKIYSHLHFPEDRITMQRWLLSFSGFPPVAFVYKNGSGQYKCVQVYCHDKQIKQIAPCAISQAYSIQRAALALSGAGSLNSLQRIIYGATAQITENIRLKCSLEFFNLLSQLLREAMQTIYRYPGATTLPISFSLSGPCSLVDDPAMLHQGTQEELIGLFYLSVVYAKIFSQCDPIQYPGVLSWWLSTCFDFYKKRDNLSKLGENGLRASGFINPKRRDVISTALQQLDRALPLRKTYQEHYDWFYSYFQPAENRELAPSPTLTR